MLTPLQQAVVELNEIIRTCDEQDDAAAQVTRAIAMDALTHLQAIHSGRLDPSQLVAACNRYERLSNQLSCRRPAS